MIDRTNIKQYLLDHSIEKAGPLATPCLVWTGNCNFEGYGLVRYEGRTQKVHRVAYKVAVGPIPEGKFICHHCDIFCPMTTCLHRGRSGRPQAAPLMAS
jgi:hypothetical protein